MALSQTQKNLIAMRADAQATGAYAGAATPQPSSGSHGRGLFDTLKDVGGTALHALSVPQAAAFTTAAKLSGRNVSWKDALGDFSVKDGKTGFQRALGSMGVHNKWAQLGIGIAADPLWFVGGGLVRTGLKGTEAVLGADRLVEAEKAAKEFSTEISRLAKNARRAKTVETREKHLQSIDDVRVKLNKLKKVIADEKKFRGHGNDLRRILANARNDGNTVGDTMRALREELSKHESRVGMNYGLRLGAGKYSKMIDLGISAEKGLLGSKKAAKAAKAGVFAMKPIEKVAHALRRSGSEMADGVTADMLRAAEKHGMTHTDEAGHIKINEDDASVLGVYRAARNVNRDLGDMVREEFKHQGRWNEAHDAVVAEMDARNKLLKQFDLKDPDARPYDAELKPLEKKQKKLQRDLDRELKNTPPEGAKTGLARQKRIDKLKEAIAANEKEIQLIHERGEYTPLGLNQEALQDTIKERQRLEQIGMLTPGAKYERVASSEKKTLAMRRLLKNPFSATTHQEFIDDLVKNGIDEEHATEMANAIAHQLESKGLPGFMAERKGDAITPEWNAYLLAGRREQKHIWRQVEQQTDTLLQISGLGKKTQLYNTIKYGRKHGQVGELSSTDFGVRIRRGIVALKGALTFVNPAHYVTNAWGDFFNRLVNGNLRHLGTSAAMPKSGMQKLANAEVYAGMGKLDHEALAKVHNIGGKDYTGEELMVLSRMSGLGRGYVGTDVAVIAEAFEKAGTKPREFYRFMQRMNVKRENAQRMETWMKHMKSGDDPITAATKTLRVHFDYQQLTEFEKLWARNLFLFYTWMKRNAVLQASGMVTRPGLYNAVYNNAERTREKFANEPGYYAEEGAIPIPGLGAIAPGSPWADIYKFDLSLDSFRKNIVGAITPVARVPVELALNKKSFTGQDIQQYEGQVTPNWMAALLHVGTPTSTKSGGEQQYGINPYLNYALSQFTGPQAGIAQTVTSPDQEVPSWQTWLSRFSGARMQENHPVQFARAAKYIEAKRKADATRARNAQQ